VAKNRDKNARAEEGQLQGDERAKSWEVLGDFTTTVRLLPISGLAMAIAVLAASVALALLRLIGLLTNLFYFGRWNTAWVSPAGNHLGMFSVLVPVGGALRFGADSRARHS
jgi:CIC family chloride channel protein